MHIEIRWPFGSHECVSRMDWARNKKRQGGYVCLKSMYESHLD